MFHSFIRFFQTSSPTMLASRRTGFICRACRKRARISPPWQEVQSPYSTATRERPLHVAVIGSGPAGFYSAYRLQKKMKDVRIDMFEQLPVPYGLARFGVAPDHPEVKVWFAVHFLACTSWTDEQRQ